MKVGGQLCVLAALALVKTPCHPLNKRLSELPEPVCMLQEEKILLLLFGIAPLFLYCPTHNLVTKLTELSRLLDIQYKSTTSTVKLLTYIFTLHTFGVSQGE
jgi:hypothetical protein